MMDAHRGQSNRCVELGNQLINNEHFAASEILKNVTKLQDLWSSVEEEWNGRKELLEQGLQLQVCCEQIRVLARREKKSAI
jgi:hypothetical protein